jgi:hypothetical protein
MLYLGHHLSKCFSACSVGNLSYLLAKTRERWTHYKLLFIFEALQSFSKDLVVFIIPI